MILTMLLLLCVCRHAAELQSPSSELLVLVHTITAEFDSANTMSGPLKASTWHKVHYYCCFHCYKSFFGFSFF